MIRSFVKTFIHIHLKNWAQYSDHVSDAAVYLTSFQSDITAATHVLPVILVNEMPQTP